MEFACAAKINLVLLDRLSRVWFRFAGGILKPDRRKPVLPASYVVQALDAEDAGDFADVGGDALELFAVADFQGQIDARVEIIGMAAEGADVGAGFADDSSDVGKHSGPVLRANQQSDGIS